jgi:LacI family transcriptional regulator
LAYLGFSRSNRNQERMDGIRECLASHGHDLTVFDCEAPTAAASELVSASFMLDRERPDAIICYNVLMAIGLMAGIQNLGLRVPQDVSVARFDNIPFGRYTMPPLTTVDQQSERMGEAGMHKLLAAINGDKSCGVTSLAPQLIVRSSVAGRGNWPS